MILITTKTGYEGSAKITYSGNFSFEKVAKRLNLVTDYADFMEIQNAALSANGQAPRFSQTSIDAWRNDNGANPTVYPNTDWQDHIYRNPSVVQNHNLSAIGGTKTVRYNLSLGYVKIRVSFIIPIMSVINCVRMSKSTSNPGSLPE